MRLGTVPFKTFDSSLPRKIGSFYRPPMARQMAHSLARFSAIPIWTVSGARLEREMLGLINPERDHLFEVSDLFEGL